MIDLNPYYAYGIIHPDYCPEKIADEIARFTKFQIDGLFKRGMGARTTRQDRGLDNVLQGIVTRKRDPILTIEQLDSFVAEMAAKWGKKYQPELIKAEAEHKFISYHASTVYELFCLAHPRVTPEKNNKHKDVDFWVDGFFAFDLKVTNWPKDWDYASHKKRFELLEYCINDPKPLIKWYYLKQGIHRWNWQNRLFIVCYDAEDFDHSSLKADFANMKEIIKSYFDRFDPSKLTVVSQKELLGTTTTTNGKGRLIQDTAFADVIWNYKDHRITTPRFPGGMEPINGFQATMF